MRIFIGAIAGKSDSVKTENSLVQGIKWQAQNTGANYQFILGIMIAVTGAVLLTAALATLFIVGSSTGVVLPFIAGTLGVLGLFSGSNTAAHGLAERETHSRAYAASPSA